MTLPSRDAAWPAVLAVTPVSDPDRAVRLPAAFWRLVLTADTMVLSSCDVLPVRLPARLFRLFGIFAALLVALLSRVVSAVAALPSVPLVSRLLIEPTVLDTAVRLLVRSCNAPWSNWAVWLSWPCAWRVN